MLLAIISNPLSAKEGSQDFGNSSPYQQVADNGAQTQTTKSVKKSASVNRADAAQTQSDTANLEEMTIYGKYDTQDPYNEDYVLPNATSDTKTDMQIMETPMNVQVISKQV